LVKDFGVDKVRKFASGKAKSTPTEPEAKSGAAGGSGATQPAREGRHMENDEINFEQVFKDLTGNEPLSWQRRLYGAWIARDVKSAIDLPTGLGKTMVMAIWLIARLRNPELGRRLLYVVDRRTVVDQATDLARLLIARPVTKFMHDYYPELPAISTLRCQLADNREWSRDPSRPAIIIGTVDLIGSGLLFSGYRSGFKSKPLQAGLLGQDSLLLLDEAHLSKPFAKLITSISSFQSDQGTPTKVICMSATSAEGDTKPFKLDNSDLADPIIEERFTATKTLSITQTDDVVDSIAAATGKFATDHPGSRIVIFVRTPKLVDDVRKALIKKNKSHETKIAMLTGTMRGLERDELVASPTDESQHERRVMQRFLKPDNDATQGECFLICTSAGEVGFDLNADHMVCDAAPIDSMIQRLGRVNRRGKGKAAIHLILAKELVDKSEIDKACAAASKLFTDGINVSPQKLAAFKQSITPEQLKAASTPEPTMVDLTDIAMPPR
jgi:CRISPR-associated endonuclease/helicase Cas3